jgi:hypothetical protein
VKIEDLKAAKDRRPFEPFWIRMADAREIEVRHPDAVSWGGESSRRVTYNSPNDQWEMIDIALVTSLGTAAATKPKRRREGNGA